MLRRILTVLLAILLTLGLGVAGFLLWITKRAEPAYAGEVRVAGLTAPVRVRWGPHAVPTIQADSLPDLLFGQGFVVASERMWQMDLMRRLADGRLAEVFGSGALDADRLFRTLGLNAAARRAYAELDAPERAMLAAYAAGVNAYRAQALERLPVEYLITGFEPAPWRPEDSLLVGAYMAWTQSFNLKEELTFLRMAARLGAARARELFPTDEGVPAPPVPPELLERPGDLGSATAATATALAGLLDLPARFGLPTASAASNAWVVTGPRTADGAALLANDPHLPPSVPGTWYEMELYGPDLHVAGLALPGVPLVLIGHNADLAWGLTSAIADTQDLFLERPTADGTEVERAGRAPEAITTRVQRIGVKDAPPVDLVVRSTRHGVILNDLLAPVPDAADGARSPLQPSVAGPYLIALSQITDPPDRSFAALVGLNRARTLAEARRAGLGFYAVAQNLMLAHRDGDIAWQVTGLLPQRRKGSGLFPAPGWIADYGWDGTVAPWRNPGQTAPAGAALVTANNRTIPVDHPVNVSHSWMAPYRAQRITRRLDESGPLTPAAMAAIQTDRRSRQALLTQQALRRDESALRAADPEAWVIAERDLLGWDGVMDGASRAAAFYALLEPALWRALYGDELGEADLAVLMSLANPSYSALQETLNTGESSFWDDVTTPEVETPAHIWARALRTAAAELATALPRTRDQRLDRLRTLTLPHAFHQQPLLGQLFDVGPIGVGGAADTVDLMQSAPADPRSVLIAPSMRVVQVPRNWPQTRGTLPLGQSGHRLSRYRTDQLDDWLHGGSHAWPWHGPTTEGTQGLLVLRPLP
ncbi:penicillin acylase family protein [Lamprocystis purpurea]|jgi:acyl-homoserine lactone acylase PvdQ|uniref:penicillin acylase family protein n=1 Tax=Lamprocystis purpurea TaxID=61598 RepID=UPI000371B274|nr:penicillin acylase family protein [Lamprocystis purpurea]